MSEQVAAYVRNIIACYGEPPGVHDIWCRFEGCPNPVAVALSEYHDQESYACADHGIEVLEASKSP